MPVGFALPSTTGPADSEDLITAIRSGLADRLPSYMIPARWLVLERLPVGSTGKVDRAALLRLLDTGPALVAAPAPLAGPEPVDDAMAEELAGFWCEVLGTDEVGAADNVLELGGDSVRAMQLVSRIGRRYGVQVDPGTVLLPDSLAELAEHVRQLGAVTA
jgi:acyl carrier protein